MNNISIIIQGPLNEISLDKIDNYSKFGKVIVSTTDLITYDLAEKYPNAIFTGTIIKPEIRPFNGCNLFYHSVNTLNGLKLSKTEFSIKIRSDEYYTDLTKFIETMVSNPNEYTTNNVFFKGNEQPLHPSDHVIGGRTSLLLDCMYNLSRLCQSINVDEYQYDLLHGSFFGCDGIGFITPESAIFLSWLRSQNIEVNAYNQHDALLNNVQLVKIEDMGDFIWTIKSNGKRHYHSTADELYTGKFPSLKTIDEYYRNEN